MPKDNIKKDEARNANRDPISGTPGAHPVGTGVGAAAGGVAGVAAGAAAGAAAGTVGAGPVGTAVGAVVGAVIGGLAGKGVAEKINPTAEDAFWREHYAQEPYYDRSYSYDEYRGAYQTGYQGYSRLSSAGKSYDEIEPELRRDYELNYGQSKLSWEKARPAVRAAWQRFDRNLEQYIGYDVADRNGTQIGTLDGLWTDHLGEPAFVGVKTGWFLGKTHVVPAESVEVNEHGRCLRLHYAEDKVKDAPAYNMESEMTEEKEREVYRYYGISKQKLSSTPLPEQPARAEKTIPTSPNRSEATVQLSEEQLKVGKREVEAGGVRLRKVIRTEMVNQQVELKREELVIERVPSGQAPGLNEESFKDQEIYIPLRREEVVVQKDVRVREEVRVRKENQTDTQTVSEQIRKEDVEIERTGKSGAPSPAKAGQGQSGRVNLGKPDIRKT